MWGNACGVVCQRRGSKTDHHGCLREYGDFGTAGSGGVVDGGIDVRGKGDLWRSIGSAKGFFFFEFEFECLSVGFVSPYFLVDEVGEEISEDPLSKVNWVGRKILTRV